MAGTGRVSLPLVEVGVKLTCVDKSAELLAILRDKLAIRNLSADVVQANVCELDLGKRFDLVIIPFSSFAHIVSPQDQLQALIRIDENLSPGGEFIVTLGNPAKRRATVDGQLHLFQKYPLNNGTLLLWVLENFSPTDDHVVEMSEFFEEYDDKGGLHSKRLMELQFRLSTREEFEQLAQPGSEFWGSTAIMPTRNFAKRAVR